MTRLDSWKEIATFLKRGLRTVQRWEREEGLPVHRLAHAKRGTVYANPDELTAWWESRRLTIEKDAAPIPVAPPAAGGSISDATLQRATGLSAVSVYPSLSSDGRLLAYVSDRGQDGGPPQVWLQQVGGEGLRLTTGLRACMEAAFSADDTRVLFTAADRDGQLSIFDVPTLGGTPRLVKRAARSARMSPDGRWLMWLSLSAPGGIRIARVDGSDERAIAPDFVEALAFAWSSASDRVLVLARSHAQSEPELWVASLDGDVRPTGFATSVRRQGIFALLPMPIAWAAGAVVFCGVTREGSGVFRQRLSADGCAPVGDAERVSPVSDVAWFPAAAAKSGRLAFVNVHTDMSLWSIAIDEHTGAAFGPLRRLTRGPGIQNFLCGTADGRYLFHASARTFRMEILRRDLESGEETRVPMDPVHAEAGYPAISPSGRQLAYAPRPSGPQAARPVYVLDLAANTTRLVCEDSGGRPRQWIDERHLILETFGTRLNSVLVLDTTTGERRDLLSSGAWSLANPRVSPDGQWIAFDAGPPGGAPMVFAAPIANLVAPPEASWRRVATSASHPFWSRDGQLLYYLTTTPYLMLRGEVRARRFTPDLPPDGESIPIVTLRESVVPAFMNGTAPVTAPDQIVLVLGDFRGDVWLCDARVLMLSSRFS